MMMLSALNEQAQRTETPEPYRKQPAMVAEIINASQSEMRVTIALASYQSRRKKVCVKY